MLYYIAYSDLICVAIVIYIWIRMHANPVFSGRARRSFIGAGSTLIMILFLDEVWTYYYWMGETTMKTANLLNTIASVEFALAPAALIFVIIFHEDMKDIGDWISISVCCLLILLNLLNIRYPIIFHHKKTFKMVYTSNVVWIYLIYDILIPYVLFHDFAHTYRIDREDRFLIIFVIVMLGIGLTGSYVTSEIDTVWICCSIALLMLYLAVTHIYDNHDPVTGLQNRNAFARELYRMRNRQMTVVSFDLNHLKVFNDRYGHRVGDQYLRAFALTMNDALKEFGEFYRTGGDEFFFITVLPDEEVQQKLEQIAAWPKCDSKYGDFPLDFSFGVAGRKEGESTEAMMDRADEIMYAYKRSTERGSRASVPPEN